jgi:hypothetical protein
MLYFEIQLPATDNAGNSYTVDRSTERVEVPPIKFYRYGRLGNVLRNFVAGK